MTNETFDFFRCPFCGFSGSVTEAEIAKHGSRCAVGSNEGVPAQPSEEKEAEYRRLAEFLSYEVYFMSETAQSDIESYLHPAIVRFYAEEKQ